MEGRQPAFSSGFFSSPRSDTSTNYELRCKLQLAEPFSEDQLRILHQAAAILDVPVNRLPEALRFAPSEQVAHSNYENEGEADAQESFLWPLDYPGSGHIQGGNLIGPLLLPQLPTGSFYDSLPLTPCASPASRYLRFGSVNQATLDAILPDGGLSASGQHAGGVSGLKTMEYGLDGFGTAFGQLGGYLPSNPLPNASQHLSDVPAESSSPARFLDSLLPNPLIIEESCPHNQEASVNDAHRSVNTQAPPTKNALQAPIDETSGIQPESVGVSSPFSITETSPSARGHLSACHSVNLEDVGNLFEATALHGPCKSNWKVSGLKPRRMKQDHLRVSKRKRRVDNNPNHPRTRGAFCDQETRNKTALTRKLKACVRCRMQKIRCEMDPNSPENSCLTCQQFVGRTLSRLPCLRYIITDASLYREQSAPYQLFSKRWQSMELVDIADWASDEIRTIEVTQVFLNAPYKLEVRKFLPVEGDLIEERWSDERGIIRTHTIPPFALADMEKTSQSIQKFIDGNISKYIIGAVGSLNPLLWNTYLMAFKHSKKAVMEDERMLLVNALRLWVACRNTSNPHRICGEDKLGVGIVTDEKSPWFNYQPMPPIIIAQKECIVYTKLLRPLSKAVLNQLQALVLTNEKKYWLTIYLTIFILLHNCSMITRRDAEYARQISLQTDYANPSSISGQHMGALIMIAHFHYTNKGQQPFTMALDPSGLQEVVEATNMDAEHIRFIKESAFMIQEREAEIRQVREARAFGNDLYWISQLYDKDWKPSPTA